MSAIPSTLGPKPPAIRNCQDLRSGVVVHHLAFQAIHDLFDGQSGWEQSHGDSHISTIGRGIPGYEHRPAPVGASGAHRGERRQVGGPRIHAVENFTTAGNGDHTHLPPASDLRQPSHPSGGPGQRTARYDGPSPPGPDIRSGSAAETQTPGPGDCLHEFQGRRWRRNPR